MRRWLGVAGMIGLRVAALGQEVHIPLNEGWSFMQAGKEDWRSAEVPGVVQTDLLRHGLIPDFMKGSNIDSVQWIENEDWIYRRTLFVADTLLHHEHLDLVFKGLDTFAEVYLNDSLIGKADNMFRTWEWSMKPLLKKGENELKVIFRSPIKEGAKLREAYGIQLPHDSDPSGVSPYIRKAAYQFGWDFCPRLVTSGIWKEVELRGWSGARIFDVLTTHSGDLVSFMVFPQYGTKGIEKKLKYEVEVNGQRVAAARNRPGHLWKLCAKRSDVIPDRWFPAGHGSHAVQKVIYRMLKGKELLSETSMPLAWTDHQFSARSDSIGGEFTAYSHARLLFAKGCNLVPPDLVPSRITDSAWVAQVSHMQRAGMNMVRVWAGGVYPPDAFLSACDTAGILVWQDYMVANLLPAEGRFLANLKEEAREQARRIAKHPSTIIFCGNNELRIAWHNWGWQERYGLHGMDSVRVIDSNERLWTREFRHSLWSNWSDRYTATSPMSNWGNEVGLKYGDLHYWGVWHGDSAFSSFKNNVGRFVSEWGFQSYPDSALLAKYIHPDSLYLGSPAVARLQRSYKTDRPIWEAIERELGEERPTTLGGFIEASQRAQAKAYQMATDAHLDARPHCMGTLLWQLNDCWPGPSWSIIDYEGNPKPAYEAVKKAFARP
ncbi:MAG: hypothetical protein IPM12_14180 [Flavobacteriales bacterium]|nr:hypothetical protein [Flavobacteriales bacterium]